MGFLDRMRRPAEGPATQDPWQVQRHRTRWHEVPPLLLTATGGLGVSVALFSLAFRLPWTWALVPLSVFCASATTLVQQSDGEARMHDAMMWSIFLGGVGLGVGVLAHWMLYGL